MTVIENERGTIAVTRVEERLTIHVCEGGRWHGLLSRSPGDARDALLRQLGPQVCERLQIQ